MDEKSGCKKTGGLFVNLVAGIYSAGMRFMGKAADPETGKIEKNLEVARVNIEMLRMLKEKTSGNLDEPESKTLDEAIANMQLNYVDELEREKRTGGAGKPG